MLKAGFSFFDYLIVFSYLGFSFYLGLKTRSYIKSMSDFIGAGKRIGTCLGIATLTGTEMGLITIMYSAQKGFVGGFAAFHIALVAGVVTFFVGLTGFIVAPLRAAGVLTIPEFYEQRFGKKVRQISHTPRTP